MLSRGLKLKVIIKGLRSAVHIEEFIEILAYIKWIKNL